MRKSYSMLSRSFCSSSVRFPLVFSWIMARVSMACLARTKSLLSLSGARMGNFSQVEQDLRAEGNDKSGKIDFR